MYEDSIKIRRENPQKGLYRTNRHYKNRIVLIQFLHLHRLDSHQYFQYLKGCLGQENNIDMLLVASYKKDREVLGIYPTTNSGDIDVTKATMLQSYFLYVLKDSKLNWDGKSFINLEGKIGATKGYSIVNFLKDKEVSVSENSSNIGDVRKLIAKRIQGFVNQESKIDRYLKSNPQYSKKIKKITLPILVKPYYILFSKEFYNKNSELANMIWNEMKYHDTNNKFEKLHKRYN